MVSFVEDTITAAGAPKIGALGNPSYVRIRSPRQGGDEGSIRISGTPSGGCVSICGVLDFRYDRFHTSVSML